ncbi:MAG: hypothetical protein ACPLGZ_01745, partial [Candidatus Pelagibacter ubique]
KKLEKWKFFKQNFQRTLVKTSLPCFQSSTSDCEKEKEMRKDFKSEVTCFANMLELFVSKKVVKQELKRKKIKRM